MARTISDDSQIHQPDPTNLVDVRRPVPGATLGAMGCVYDTRLPATRGYAASMLAVERRCVVEAACRVAGDAGMRNNPRTMTVVPV